MLVALRERAGLTQEELAERAGISPHAISALERGTRTRPYPHTVRSLADALALTDDERARLVGAVPTRARAETAPRGSLTAPPDPPVAVARPAGLVIPPTRLFGRTGDIAAVAALARSGARLVTLTGPGGVGKTRLLAAVSEELAGDHVDGVVQIALASLTDASEVVPTIGRALGLAGSQGADALEAVESHLAELDLLLVLDNAEHLLSAAGEIGRLVARCSRLTVLVSSRSPLRVRGEREHAVLPLALPAAGARTVDDLAASPAGALVLDRSRDLALHHEPDADDVAALAELCRRLAGLPLALELATSRLRSLPPTVLLERLDDVALTSGARDLPPRQRTMRATLDWSHGLLDAEQQALFAMLGVFRSGATLEDVELVAEATGTVARRSVVVLLEQLVEHSLVVVRPGVDRRHRYDLLEPVAQYARTLLVGPGAVAAARAHAAVYARLAEAAAVGYERHEQVTWLARAAADDANLVVAIKRALDLGDAETAARITWSMWLCWWLRGQVAVGRRWAERCLEHELAPTLLGRVRLAAATMSYAGGDFVASAGHWAEADQLGTLHADLELGCKARAGLGLAALAAGDLESAAARFSEALPLCRDAGEAGVWMQSLTHVWLGTVVLLQGDPAAATGHVERGLALAQARGDRLTTYVARYNLARTAVAADDLGLARDHLHEGIRLSEQTNDLANLAYFLDSLAVVESAVGRHDRVPVLLAAARSLRSSVGANVYAYYLPDDALRDRAEASARAELGDDDYDDAADLARSMPPETIVRFALSTG